MGKEFLPYKPTKEEVQAARDKSIADVIAPGLKILWVGINPGLYTAAIGHHFGRPGNRFWPALVASGFTERLLSPFEERELLKLGYGITNLVNRATVTADEVSVQELREGAKMLEAKAKQFRPRVVAILGIGAYRVAFHRPKALLGPQADSIGGALAWILPNPSGLNAHYGPEDLARLFHELRMAAETGSATAGLSR